VGGAGTFSAATVATASSPATAATVASENCELDCENCDLDCENCELSGDCLKMRFSRPNRIQEKIRIFS
jgi:hypothetical protein